jgi:ubiquinone/menaquinone biosynthesis C-methylase UbiE
MIRVNLVIKITTWFLDRLYTQFAWGYDLVAAVVSAGQWNHWVNSIISLIQDDHILEIAFGPGHLQKSLSSKFRYVYGVDASQQMARIAHLRSVREDRAANLIQAYAQFLPLPAGRFKTIVSTFPAAFIIQIETLAEMRRVIKPDGKVLILVSVQPKKTNFLWNVIAWLFHITAQSALPPNWIFTRIQQAGFNVDTFWLDAPHGRLLFLEARPG